jgi:hypothetical protein
VGLVKLMEMRRLVSLADLVGRIGELEAALRTGNPPAERKTPQAAPDSGSGKAPARSASAGSSQSASANIAGAREATSAASAASNPDRPSGSMIDKIKSVLEKKKRRMLIAAIDDAVRADLEGDELLIEFTPEARHSRDTLAKADNAKALREACYDICGREIGIRFATKADSDGQEPLSPEEEERRTKTQTRQAVAQNPTVQQVLRTFGGEIVDIKMQ